MPSTPYAVSILFFSKKSNFSTLAPHLIKTKTAAAIIPNNAKRPIPPAAFSEISNIPHSDKPPNTISRIGLAIHIDTAFAIFGASFF